MMEVNRQINRDERLSVTARIFRLGGKGSAHYHQRVYSERALFLRQDEYGI